MCEVLVLELRTNLTQGSTTRVRYKSILKSYI